MSQASFWRTAAASLVLLAAASAQEWTEEELEERIQGFLEPGANARLEQIAALVRQQAEAGRAIAAKIHGDHREYLLKIERLIDQLTDPRWLEREKAERVLVEIGARARSLLRQRQETGELLEERIRCERILQRIDARGTEREEQEIQMLRGLVDTALYLEGSPRLQRALLSALGHTDPAVVQGAVRALGRHGEGDHVKAVVRLLGRDPTLRRIALASIATMRGEAALAECRALLQSDDLGVTEKVALLRVLRERADAAPLLAEAASHPDPLVAAAAALALPPGGGQPTEVRIALSDRSYATASFLGFSGDRVLVSSPVEGLARLELPLEECRTLDFERPPDPIEGGVCRVFLKQGSLVLGQLVALDGDALRIDSPVLGPIEVPRSEIQGIAFDPALDRLIGASTAVDRVRLRSQKLLDGRIRGITPSVVTLATGTGEVATDMAEVAGVLFTRPLQSPTDPELYTRIDLVAGDRLLGHLAGISQSAVGIVTPILGSAVIPIGDVARIEVDVSGGALWGFTLIADYSDNRIVEVDEQGKEVFVMEEIYGAWDVECLDSGNLLITEFSVSRVQEVTRSGQTVWSYEDLRNPYDADRLPNGNTLIADTFRGRVIEVDAGGQVVWQYADSIRPFDVDRLPSGNTLIADVLKDRVLEVDAAGQIVWEKKNLPSVHDADRLPNGNTLITLRTLNRVIEIDGSGKEVFRLGNLEAPSDADRLPNGNTVVAENNMVREFDRNGVEVWKKEMTWAVEVNRY